MKNIKNSLKEVLTIFQDSIKGYAQIANGTENEDIKTLFLKISQERSKDTAKIEEDLRAFGIEVTPAVALKGYLHHIWIDIYTNISLAEEATIIEKCVLAEQEVLFLLSKILSKENADVLPKYLRASLLKLNFDVTYHFAKLIALKSTLAINQTQETRH